MNISEIVSMYDLEWMNISEIVSIYDLGCMHISEIVSIYDLECISISEIVSLIIYTYKKNKRAFCFLSFYSLRYV